MTISDILKVVSCPILITTDEDPNCCRPEITVDSISPSYWLSDDVLNSEVHLMTIIEGKICISIL